jgi:iron(III) transport system ATP-binding protein
MTALELAGITKSFGAQQVLRDVNLEVPPGSFTAILGPSGSGKTTLLRIVAGFERPDRGELVLGSEIVDDAQQRFVPPERRRIGYVPQEGALFPHLSVARNVSFGLPRGRDRHARVRALLELVGLRGHGRRYPHQLSGGQQQRVALARALAIEPEIVLLDEPFSSLDATLRASMRADVHAVLRQAGTTCVLVTHDQDEALSMADQVAVLREGVVAQRDTPSRLYENPGDEQVANFLGVPNVVDGLVDGPVVSTVLGPLGLAEWSGRPGGAARVMVRPEQFALVEPGSGEIEGTVTSSAYFGHDSVLRVRLAVSDLPELVVRIAGGSPMEQGRRVGLRVRGPVVAWPARPTDDGGVGRMTPP